MQKAASVGAFGLVLPEQVSGAAQHLGAPVVGQRGPVALGLRRGLGRLVHVGLCRRADTGQRGAGGGLDGVVLTTGAGHPPARGEDLALPAGAVEKCHGSSVSTWVR
jgi:hypothetical protein